MNYCGLSDQGRVREDNQDSFIVVKNLSDNILAVVCDGIGGARNGDWASNLVCTKLSDDFRESTAFSSFTAAKKWFKTQIETINAEIFQNSLLNEGCKGMGTTMVGVLLFNNRVLVANCGDSRCYQLNEKGLTQITKDHTLVYDLIEKGALSPKQARMHPGRHILSTAVGVDKNLKVDYYRLDMTDGPILLCSDGLYGMVNNDTIKKVLKKKTTCEKKTGELLDIANNNGGYDNITVVLLER